MVPSFISVLGLVLFDCKDPVSIRHSFTLELQEERKFNNLSLGL